MRSFKTLILLITITTFNSQIIFCQKASDNSEIAQITSTLNDYIDGTGNGELDRLKRAFHPEFNLYTVTEEDSLRIRSGKKYISYFKEGQKTNRIGRIISIDYENDAAIAKVEIAVPDMKVAVAHAAGFDANQNLRACRLRGRRLARLQRLAPLDDLIAFHDRRVLPPMGHFRARA